MLAILALALLATLRTRLARTARTMAARTRWRRLPRARREDPPRSERRPGEERGCERARRRRARRRLPCGLRPRHGHCCAPRPPRLGLGRGRGGGSSRRGRPSPKAAAAPPRPGCAGPTVAAAIAARRERRSPRAGAKDGEAHIAEAPGGGAPATTGGLAAACSAKTQGAAAQVSPFGGRRRGEGRAKGLTPRKCPACDVMITPESQTDHMWRKALALHLNGPAHGMAMAPELQDMIEREGLHRCQHCLLLFGNRAQQHILQCEQRPSPLRAEQYAAAQPNQQERGQRERAEQRDRRRQSVAPDTTNAFAQLQTASPQASVEGGSAGGTPTGYASHADPGHGLASAGGSPSSDAPEGNTIAALNGVA